MRAFTLRVINSLTGGGPSEMSDGRMAGSSHKPFLCGSVAGNSHRHSSLKSRGSSFDCADGEISPHPRNCENLRPCLNVMALKDRFLNLALVNGHIHLVTLPLCPMATAHRTLGSKSEPFTFLTWHIASVLLLQSNLSLCRLGGD